MRKNIKEIILTIFLFGIFIVVVAASTHHFGSGDGIFQPIVTEGSLTDSVIVSADIKNGTVASVDLVTALRITSQTSDDLGDNGELVFTAGYDRVYVDLTVTADDADIDIDEGGSEVDGAIVIITNMGANTARFADEAGEVELKAPCNLEQYETLTLQYATDRWVEIARSTNAITFSSIDISGGTFTSGYQIISPQSATYSGTDENQTIGTDITSSVVLVTAVDDNDDESIDLQDGTVAGQIVTFIVVANVDDTDDAFIIDAETDSTCTGCPDSGIFTLETEGSSVTLYWTGSFWHYCGSTVGE